MEEVKLEIPGAWSDVSVATFQRLQALKQEDYDSQLLYLIDAVSILADVDKDVISGINMDNLNILATEMAWMQEQLPSDKKDEIVIDGTTYKWKVGFNKLTVGEVVSIEQVIDLEQLSYVDSMDIILAVLLREVKEDGTLEDFNADLFQANRNLFAQLPITDVYGMIIFFFTWRSSLYTKFSGLFKLELVALYGQ